MRQPRTIEQTDKRFKAIQLIGAGLAILSVGSCSLVVGGSDGGGSMILATFGIAAGVCMFIVGRVLAWWNHG